MLKVRQNQLPKPPGRNRFQNKSPPVEMNVLEILSSRKVPDAVLTVMLTFLSALTLAPYLGGRSLWILGGSPVVIPTLSEQLFWFIVLATPVLWSLFLGRIFFAGRRKIAKVIISAFLITVALATMHSCYPTIGLTAIDSSYTEDHEAFKWLVTAAHQGNDYVHFRSDPIDLQVQKGCALRVERLEISAGAWAGIQKSNSAFDIKVFVSTSKLLQPTANNQQGRRGSDSIKGSSFERLTEEPSDAEVKGRAVVKITKDDIAKGENHINLNISYDFINRSAKVAPSEYAKKKLEQTDLVVRSSPARLQLAAWTLYGDEVALTIYDPVIRITGKVHCSIVSWMTF